MVDYGYTVWWDYLLISGHDFGVEIERELRAAKTVIVLWCTRSVMSEWVREEATLAKRLKKIIPTMIETADLPLGFSLSQTLDLSKWNGSPQSDDLDRLLRDIGRSVGKPPKPDHEKLDRSTRAWRRFGAPTLREFALVDELEASLPLRVLPGLAMKEPEILNQHLSNPPRSGLGQSDIEPDTLEGAAPKGDSRIFASWTSLAIKFLLSASSVGLLLSQFDVTTEMIVDSAGAVLRFLWNALVWVGPFILLGSIVLLPIWMILFFLMPPRSRK